MHVAKEQRNSTFAEKAYKGFFVGLRWLLLDRYLVFVPELDKVMENGHVLCDEVTKLTRRMEELLVVDLPRRRVKDFEYLTGMLYVDLDTAACGTSATPSSPNSCRVSH